MNPTTPLKVAQFGYYIGDDDRHLGDKTNIVELEQWKRENRVWVKPRVSLTTSDIRAVMDIALLARRRDPNKLEERADGFYLSGEYLGKNIREAYMEIIQNW